VTRWSRLDNRWKGVLFTDVLKLVRAEGGGKVCAGAGGRGIHGECAAGRFDAAGCAVLRLSTMARALTADHGGPLRLIVPHLYAWKSVKWVRGFMLLDEDRLGFWERNGYHAYGDPWKEQRYSGAVGS